MAASRLLVFVLCLSCILRTKSEDSDVSVACNKNDMTVYLRKAFLSDFYIDDLRLQDTACSFESSENFTHFVMSVPLVGCGTYIKYTNLSVIYTNVIQQRPLGQNVIINRLPEVEIPIRCSYLKKISASYADLIAKHKKLELKVEDGSGEFNLQMTLFWDESYTDFVGLEKFPLKVALNQRLYFQLAVDSPDKSLTIIADTCYATPTRIPTEEGRYVIIQHGCSKDDTFKTYRAPPGAQRFSFQSFQFLRSSDIPYVFIHCEVRVCNASDGSSICAKGCDNELFTDPMQRMRRATNEDMYNLEQGPIVLISEVERLEPEEIQNHADDSTIMSWVLTGMGLICFTCFIVVLYTRRELIRARHDTCPPLRETRL